MGSVEDQDAGAATNGALPPWLSAGRVHKEILRASLPGRRSGRVRCAQLRRTGALRADRSCARGHAPRHMRHDAHLILSRGIPPGAQLCKASHNRHHPVAARASPPPQRPQCRCNVKIPKELQGRPGGVPRRQVRHHAQRRARLTGAVDPAGHSSGPGRGDSRRRRRPAFRALLRTMSLRQRPCLSSEKLRAGPPKAAMPAHQLQST